MVVLDIAKRIPSIWIGMFLLAFGMVGLIVEGWRWSPAPAILLPLGGASLVLGLREASVRLHLSRSGVETIAAVTTVERNPWARGFQFGVTRLTDWDWILRYSYKDGAGRSRIGSAYLSPNEAAGWHAGQECRVRFDPGDAGQSLWFGSAQTGDHAPCGKTYDQ